MAILGILGISWISHGQLRCPPFAARNVLCALQPFAFHVWIRGARISCSLNLIHSPMGSNHNNHSFLFQQIVSAERVKAGASTTLPSALIKILCYFSFSFLFSFFFLYLKERSSFMLRHPGQCPSVQIRVSHKGGSRLGGGRSSPGLVAACRSRKAAGELCSSAGAYWFPVLLPCRNTESPPV